MKSKGFKLIASLVLIVILIFLIYLGINLKQRSIQVNNYISEISTLQNEMINLQDKARDLENKLTQSLEENNNLKKMVDQYENGAPKTLEEIKNAYNQNKFDDVKKLYKRLLQYHPESNEAGEAKKIIKEIEIIEENERQRVEEEKEREKQQAERTAKEKARSILRISSVYPSKPNSVGGVDLYITGQNKSGKDIKYIYFIVRPYNAVNDLVACEIRGSSYFKGKETGPIKSGRWFGKDGYWETAWYNSTIKHVEIEKIEIEYMDDTSIELIGKDIDYIIY